MSLAKRVRLCTLLVEVCECQRGRYPQQRRVGRQRRRMTQTHCGGRNSSGWAGGWDGLVGGREGVGERVVVSLRFCARGSVDVRSMSMFCSFGGVTCQGARQFIGGREAATYVPSSPCDRKGN